MNRYILINKAYVNVGDELLKLRNTNIAVIAEELSRLQTFVTLGPFFKSVKHAVIGYLHPLERVFGTAPGH